MAKNALTGCRSKGLTLAWGCLTLGFLCFLRPASGLAGGKAKVHRPAVRKAMVSAAASERRRDPFAVPPVPKGGASGPMATGPLPPGKRGLVIGTLRLEGIVREDRTNTMIAVVTNATNRAYFLRNSDEVYNGKVSKITSDSVYFTENILNHAGRVQNREVALKLGAAPGEGR